MQSRSPKVFQFLTGGERESRLNDVVLGLCAEMLVATGLTDDRDDAAKRCDEAVTSGRAAEIFENMCAALGGPADFVDKFESYLPKANVVRPVHGSGYLQETDTRAIGNAIIELGGGRQKVGEDLDLSVGFTDFAAIGSNLDDVPLAIVHAASETDADEAEASLLAACATGADAPDVDAVICGILAADQ